MNIVLNHAVRRVSAGGLEKERMTTIILTRHGRVEGIQPARFRGRQHASPSEQGVPKAHIMGPRIGPSWRQGCHLYELPGTLCGDRRLIGEAFDVEPIATADDLRYADWRWKNFLRSFGRAVTPARWRRHPVDRLRANRERKQLPPGESYSASARPSHGTDSDDIVATKFSRTAPTLLDKTRVRGQPG